ncbi:uncharacterized protein LOC131324467 [Rhododendron vialii]|uniref:uncharacterized protein LOC131324467 n=1 Tax=Rhododendron vialii TaxID=182163 RepID=UPI00265ECB00|nr:uncharacterized protein LOC131324467 [Rhododendron vialii]
MAHPLAQAEVYAPWSLQLWRALVNWLAFLSQIVLQILTFSPSLAQLLSSIGLRHTLLPSPSLSFKPLPHVELESPPPSSVAPTTPADANTTTNGGGRAIEILTVVLDLDETLVCAYETSSLPAVIRSTAIAGGLEWFELKFVSSEKEFQGNPKVSYVTVFKRPGLHKFLKQIGEFADVVLFTAGLEDYARPLVDLIDVDNQFCLRFYRPSTVSMEFREHVKDLSCLSKDLCRVVLVDNNPFSFLLQPLNGLPCISFSAEHPYDEQLLKVILPLLQHLSLQKDVRPVLYEKFNMPEWFQMHGIPASSLIV